MRAPDPWLLLALALALAVRAALFVLALPHPERFFTPDAAGYMALAGDLQAGYLQPGSATFDIGLMRTPGYPLWAAAVLRLSGGRIPPLIASQIALSLVSVWLTYLLGRRLFGARAGHAAALVVALDPASALYTCFLQPEALFVVITVGAAAAWLYALEDHSLPLAAACGGLLGLATLTRPIAVYLPAAFLLIAAARSSTSRQAGRPPQDHAVAGESVADPRSRPRRPPALLAAALVVFHLMLVGAWIARNHSVTGVAFLSTIDGTNMLYYRAAGALAADNGSSLDDARQALRSRLAEFPATGNAAERSRAESALALTVLAEHPTGALTSAFRGGLMLVAGTGLTAFKNLQGSPAAEEIGGARDLLVTGLFGLATLLLFGTAVAGAIDLVRQRAFASLALPLAISVYFLALSAGPEANTRFRVPLTPFLGLLAGHWIAEASGRFRPAGAIVSRGGRD